MTKAELVKEIEQLKDMQIHMNKRLRELEASTTPAPPHQGGEPDAEVEAVLEIARVRAAGIDLEAYLRQRGKRRQNSPRAYL